MTTPILQLDELAAAQSQPEIIVNAAFRWLECFCQLSVISQVIGTPPGSPADGDTYIVAAGATGTWSGHDGQIALYMGTAWAFRSAPDGAIAYVQSEGVHYTYVASDSPPTWSLL